MSKLKILYFGVFSHVGWGAETFINEGFKKLGHETLCIDYRKNRDMLTTNTYIELLDDDPPDVVFIQRGDMFPISIIELFNDLEIPVVWWASELVSRCRDQDRLLAHFDNFDHIYFHTSDCIKLACDKFDDRIKNRSSVLLNGFDRNIYEFNNMIEKDIDILFCGNITKRRQNILSSINNVFKVNVVSKIYGKEVCDLFNRSKIVLNIHADDFLDTETRVFEVIGSGGFLLTEKLSLDSPLKNMIHYVEFENIQELLWRINYYLNSNEYRSVVSTHGYLESTNHTYDTRAMEIVQKLEEVVENKVT